MNVTLRKDGVGSVNIPLVEESGEQLFSADLGKPELNIRDSGGTLYPRIQDQWSGLTNYALIGRLFDYQKSHDLADLVATADPSNPLLLDNPLPEYPDTAEVAPSAGAEQALSLSYPPGKRNNVNVELSLTRVSNTTGGITQPATTPTTTGTGPVQLKVNNTTIDLPTQDLEISRGIGRPNDVVRRSQDNFPRYIVKPKVTFDEFSLSFQSIESVPSTITDIVDNIFETNLGRTPLKLDFNGIFGLGELAVVPTGSAPFRQLRQAGEKSTIIAPTLDLRRVFDVG